MLQTMRNHLELHLLSKFPLTFHIFVLRMQRGIFQHAANFFCQNLCHQKSFKTFLGRVVYFILVQEGRKNFCAINLRPNEMIFWVLRREIRCSANILRHKKGIYFVTTFIQFPGSYTVRPKFEKCIIEESVTEYLRLMLVFVWNSVLREGFNCYLFEVFR